MIEERLGFDEIYMDLACSLAKRSTCSRLHVGCVVVSDDNQRVLAIGYNGSWRGGPNRCDSIEPGLCGCIHAEQNALIKLNYNEPCFKRLYTTVSPCSTCAKFIVNAGINEVVFLEKYRTTKGLEILEEAGILYHQLEVKRDVQVAEDKEAGRVRVELRATPIQSIGQIAPCEILDPPSRNSDSVQDREETPSLLSRLVDYVLRRKKSP